MSDIVLTEQMVLSRTRSSSLNDVKKLNYWASNLSDISILNKMPNIEILTLSVNNIKTLKDLQNCTNLTELYIRNNNIIDINDIYYLKNLNKLKILWLADNPCALDENYRLIVLKTLPNLSKLDNAAVTPEELESAKQLDYELDLKNIELSKTFESELTNLINDFKLDENNLLEESCLNTHESKEEIESKNTNQNTNLLSSDNNIDNKSSKNDDETENTNENKEVINESEDINDKNMSTNASIENTDQFSDTLHVTNSATGVEFQNVEEKRTQFTRMSIEETNKLRLELGLKPLPAPTLNPINTQINQSPNVLAAVLALVKELNVDGLDMVIDACQCRKELLKSVYEV